MALKDTVDVKNPYSLKNKKQYFRKIANTSRQELCYRLHMFRICRACLQDGGWHFKTLLQNMVS
jgi:hypothetical protein